MAMLLSGVGRVCAPPWRVRVGCRSGGEGPGVSPSPVPGPALPRPSYRRGGFVKPAWKVVTTGVPEVQDPAFANRYRRAWRYGDPPPPPQGEGEGEGGDGEESEGAVEGDEEADVEGAGVHVQHASAGFRNPYFRPRNPEWDVVRPVERFRKETCEACGGRGSVGEAFFNKRNQVNVAKLVGTKWTAMTPTTGSAGTRHDYFTVVARHKEEGAGTKKQKAMVVAEMAAECNRASRVWVPVGELRDRERWRAGWRSGLKGMKGDRVGGLEDPTVKACQSCKGAGEIVVCVTDERPKT